MLNYFKSVELICSFANKFLYQFIMQRNELQSAKAQSSAPYQQMPNPPLNYTEQQQGLLSQNRVDDYAADSNQLKQQKSSCHVRPLIASIFLFGGIITGLVFYFSQDQNLTGQGLMWVCISSYVLYLLIACCCNPLSQYLNNISRGQNFEGDYEELRKKIGYFVFHAQCYHYETRYHTRTVTDSNGDTRTQTYTTEQRVVTHTATQNLHPINTVDQSGSIDQIRAATMIVFIHYFVRYRFVDSMSEMNFDRIYASFKLRNTRDVHQNFSYRYEVPGVVERKTYFIGDLECDFGTWYYLFGFVGLLWPYSLWVQSKISRFKVDTMKVVTI